MLSPDFAQKPLAQENPAEFVSDAITELLRAHAQTLIAAALEAEVASVVAQLKASGANVVRNGYLPERKVTTAIGDVEVKVPRIRAKDGAGVNFTSALVPKYLRRSKSVSAWAAYAYLKG
ncbi:MAG: transposase, partial [Actinomycetota bacterium]|nr:transposase [Actinomycetota bacterium]